MADLISRLPIGGRQTQQTGLASRGKALAGGAQGLATRATGLASQGAQRVTRKGGNKPSTITLSSPVVAGAIAAVVVAFAAGALAHRFVFDRQNARRRRHAARERSTAKLRRRARDTAKRARYLEGVAEGAAHKAALAVPGTNKHKEPLDDVSLAQKVESEAFRHAGVSKAHVSVNAEGGVVYLRGRLENDDQINGLVKAARAVDGVKHVESKLHTPDAASDGGS